MGKTPLPLRLLVYAPWVEHPTMVALAGQGHIIVPFEATVDGAMADLILHPAAHRWTDEFWAERSYLTAALKRARMVKRAL